ncbi:MULTISPECIES: hypothetical protein [unclassified Streptomyces]|uniref:hypothetical protein n=1 Tax=unclassified Streptomyces TaxID=2593676 RepID=UPI00110F9BB5|nr:hypothetical protein [Streptomyces sp. DASNCL29]TMU98195.1 hypothetical protein FGK60_10310 [Streptomyces sp. DASNCL29]
MAGFTKYTDTFGFRLTFAESCWTDHDLLIEHLTHPRCGIALKERMSTCTCSMGERGCRLWFDGPEQIPGRLDLQMHEDDADCEIAEYNQALTFTGQPERKDHTSNRQPAGHDRRVCPEIPRSP